MVAVPHHSGNAGHLLCCALLGRGRPSPSWRLRLQPPHDPAPEPHPSHMRRSPFSFTDRHQAADPCTACLPLPVPVPVLVLVPAGPFSGHGPPCACKPWYADHVGHELKRLAVCICRRRRRFCRQGGRRRSRGVWRGGSRLTRTLTTDLLAGDPADAEGSVLVSDRFSTCSAQFLEQLAENQSQTKVFVNSGFPRIFTTALTSPTARYVSSEANAKLADRRRVSISLSVIHSFSPALRGRCSVALCMPFRLAFSGASGSGGSLRKAHCNLQTSLSAFAFLSEQRSVALRRS